MCWDCRNYVHCFNTVKHLYNRFIGDQTFLHYKEFSVIETRVVETHIKLFALGLLTYSVIRRIPFNIASVIERF